MLFGSRRPRMGRSSASSNIRRTGSASPRFSGSAPAPTPPPLPPPRSTRGPGAGSDAAHPRPPGFHKTNPVDYAIVLSGEIYARMDEGEVLLKAGDVLVQRGTNHAWSNRADESAYVAFVLIDAEPV